MVSILERNFLKIHHVTDFLKTFLLHSYNASHAFSFTSCYLMEQLPTRYMLSKVFAGQWFI